MLEMMSYYKLRREPHTEAICKRFLTKLGDIEDKPEHTGRMETHVILLCLQPDDELLSRKMQKLDPFVTELNRHLAQGFEKLREGPREGEVAAGQPLSYTNNTCQQISDNVRGLLSTKAVWMSPVLRKMAPWATLTGNMQGGGHLGRTVQTSHIDTWQSRHTFLRPAPPCRATCVFGTSNLSLPFSVFSRSPLPT